MEASWLLPIKRTYTQKVKCVPISQDQKSPEYFYRIAKENGTDPETCQRISKTFFAMKKASEEERLRKLANRPIFLEFGKCPHTTGGGGHCVCEATLMNGLRCSSRARFGKYCGRHKLN